MKWSILICDRGIVLAGVVRPHPANPMVVIIDRCQTVRIWGTSAGVGQLGLKGPTPTTKLDPEGDGVELNQHYLMRRIDCAEEACRAWTRFTA